MKRMIRTPLVRLVDDDDAFRESQREFLKAMGWQVEDYAGAADLLERDDLSRPGCLVLDIRMPGMTGVEAARAIAQLPVGDETDDGWPGCEIVFVTAYDEYAVEAFEQGAADYVLKPAERERLARTAERLRSRIAQRASDDEGAAGGGGMQQLLQKLATHLNPAAAPTLKWIQASVGQSIQMIPVEEVLFFISDEKYTRVQTAGVEALIRKPIKELVAELDAGLFWQIHRSTLVNVKAIAGVSRDLRGRQIVSVKGHPEKLEVSRGFTGLFKGM